MSPTRWRKSSYSAAVDNCVEVADLPTSVAVRDSKHQERSPLVFDNHAWTTFVRGIKESQTF
ncbi:DUF397 domain-containing protein [Halostreptopolyspora alba]|uniref:DUF397 domain-containing protein n=1 Tax=Halostreptopolyspora alba TaxID=2487137 RepID=A0A3N0EF46_9ACTN|nr:DUF397 domain-containing protein [Nocardiopsaceae bacterium YIM 96095]